jgi:sialic acid synthase SpsE
MSKPESELAINGRRISHDSPTYFIADIAANHDGNLERAKTLIRRAAEAGADAAKFQHFQADTIVSDKGFRSLGSGQSHQAKWKKSVFEVYKDASVALDWTGELQAACENAGVAFFTSPYSFDLIDHIDAFVPAYKIGSGDLTWHEIIAYIAAKQKPYILATGASTMDEVVAAVEVALAINSQFALLQCNTNYTGSLENFKFVQLKVLQSYASAFPGMILGLSDHTPGHATVLGAVSLGARIVEKHFTDDVTREGPDHAFSMDPRSWREMVNRTRELENALGSGIKRVEENEKQTVVVQRRSIRLTSDLSAGHRIVRSDLSVLRPCPPEAISPARIGEVVGRVLAVNKSAGDFLRDYDLVSA